MRQIEVFQLDVENVIVIGDFNGVGIGMGVALCVGVGTRSPFRPVAHLCFLGERQRVLPLKEHGKGALYLGAGVFKVQRGKDRCQYIRVMFNVVQVVAVFVIARMVALDIVYPALQLRFKGCIVGFRTKHIRVL